ncbi:MAG: phospholipase D-like domain-containing protein [Methanomassiliicoccales archaeon]|nr:phospholipase D-like domain-containing protein [Methanomassiliicoccales archaeon]
MRWPSLALFFILVLPTIQYGLSSTVPESCSGTIPFQDSQKFGNSSLGGLLIMEIMPAFEMEYVIIGNLGPSSVDLVGVQLSDGEGSFIFGHRLLSPGGELVVCGDLSLFERIHDSHPAIAFDDPSLTKKGRFILADAGDEVLLIGQASSVIDMVAYGASDYQGAGWQGDPCPKPGSGDSLSRIGSRDSDRSGDWTVSVPGRAELEPTAVSALVEPFTFPEQGRERILRELAYAQSIVRVAVYEISDQCVVGGLLNCSGRGVAVTLLVEAEPVGGRSKAENGALDALQAAGVNICLIKSYNGYKRFAYLHCKYIIIDERRLMVMSENLVPSSLDDNRGWGVVVESEGLARSFAEMFDSDSLAKRPDIQSYRQAGNAFTPLYNESEVDIEDAIRAKAIVSSVISPDWSMSSLLRCISEATDRILVEQLYFEEALLRDHLLPALAAAAGRGVDVRILLDNEWYNQMGTKNNTLAVELIEQEGDRLGLALHAKLVSRYQRFGTLHNKGVVIDDAALVSSINWNFAALLENRECGLLVQSATVADFFAQGFEKDWKEDPNPPTIRIDGSMIVATEGEPIYVSAGNCSDESGISRVEWDLFADGTVEATGRLYKAELSAGDYTLRLTVFDGFNNSASQLLSIHIDARAAAGGQEYLLVVLAAGSIITAWRVLVRIKRH